MARFAGKVQGVVVQMRIFGFFPFNWGYFFAGSEINGNLTYIEGEHRFLYSISASARAVSQWVHQ